MFILKDNFFFKFIKILRNLQIDNDQLLLLIDQANIGVAKSFILETTESLTMFISIYENKICAHVPIVSSFLFCTQTIFTTIHDFPCLNSLLFCYDCDLLSASLFCYLGSSFDTQQKNKPKCPLSIFCFTAIRLFLIERLLFISSLPRVLFIPKLKSTNN